VIYGDKFGTLSFYDKKFPVFSDCIANNAVKEIAVTWIKYTYAM